MTLIATVLLSAIAATIAMVLIRQTVLIARTETVRNDFDVAYSSALSVKVAFEAELAADPNFLTKRLFRYERPRLCTIGYDQTAIIPPVDPAMVNDNDPAAAHNVAWPATCPATWNYLASGQRAVGTDDKGKSTAYLPEQHPVRAQVSTPTPEDPALHLTVVASRGQTEAAFTASYRISSAGTITLYSGGDLRLDSVYGLGPAGASVDVKGTAYATSRLFLPTNPATYTGAQLFAESSFVGGVPANGKFYASVPVGPVKDIRGVLDAPLTMDSLRSSYPRLAAAACPGGTPQAYTAQPLQGSYSTFVCLVSGQSVRTASNSVVPVSAAGAAPAAYLLLPGGSAANPTLSVFVASVAPTDVGDCLIRCDLRALAQGDLAAGLHPGTAANISDPANTAKLWKPLGVLPYPASGVVLTDADTYVGQCPQALTDSGSCATSLAQRSLTVVAGSPASPHDLIVAGSLAPGPASGASTPSLGLVATGSLVVPWYSRAYTSSSSTQGSLNVQASLAAFGYGLKPGVSALRGFPARLDPQDAGGSNYGATFTLTGSLAAPSVETALPGWRSVVIGPDPLAISAPPPYFPGFTSSWVPTGLTRATASVICGAPSCASVW